MKKRKNLINYIIIILSCLILTLIIFVALINIDFFKEYKEIIATILSGLFTLFGLILTLIYNENARHDEFIKRIIPFIKATKNDSIFNFEVFEPITIENISEYPLIEFELDSIICYHNGNDIQYNPKNKVAVKFLPKGESFTLFFEDFPFNINDFRSFDVSDYLELNMDCTYKDYMDQVKYSHNINLVIKSLKNNIGSIVVSEVTNTYNNDAITYNKETKKFVKNIFKNATKKKWKDRMKKFF